MADTCSCQVVRGPRGGVRRDTLCAIHGDPVAAIKPAKGGVMADTIADHYGHGWIAGTEHGPRMATGPNVYIEARQSVLNEVAVDIHRNLYTNTKSGNRRAMFNVVRRVAAKMGLEVPTVAKGGGSDGRHIS
jgi:hypothetical protein